MNITERIAKKIGGEEEIIINNNKEIQIYGYHAGVGIINYRWRDNRYESTSDEYGQTFESIDELIIVLKNHLNNPPKEEDIFIKKIRFGILKKIKDLELKIQLNEPCPEKEQDVHLLIEIDDKLEECLNNWYY